MKKPSSDLFDLIHSLDISQVRYIRKKLRTADQNDSNNAAIFEILRKQFEFSEEELRDSLDFELSPNQLSVAKNYLYHTILLHLTHRSERQDSANNIRMRLQYLEVLFHKGLINQCSKLIKRVEKSAREVGHPILIHQVMIWKNRVMDQQLHGLAEEEFRKRQKSFSKNAEEIKNFLDYHSLHHDFMYRIRNHSEVERPDFIAYMEDFFSHPLLARKQPPTSVNSALHYHSIHGNRAFFIGELEVALDHFNWMIKACDQSPGLIKKYKEYYVGTLYQAGLTHFKLGNIEHVDELLNKISSVSGPSVILEARKFFSCFQLELALLAQKRETDGIHSFLSLTEGEFERHKLYLSRGEIIQVLFDQAAGWFWVGEHSKSARQLEGMLAQSGIRKFRSVWVKANLILVLMAMCRNDRDLFKYYSRALNRFWLKGKSHFQLEEEILTALKNSWLGEKAGFHSKTICSLLEKIEGQGFMVSKFDLVYWLKKKNQEVNPTS